MDPAHRAWPRPAAPPTVIHVHTYAGAYLYLVWTQRAELGLDPLPPRVHPAEAWQQYAPFLQAGGAVLMRTAVLLGTKTLGAAVATRLGPASIASHQVTFGWGIGWGGGMDGRVGSGREGQDCDGSRGVAGHRRQWGNSEESRDWESPIRSPVGSGFWYKGQGAAFTAINHPSQV